MSAPVSFERSGGRLRCEVHGIPDWEGFDKLIRFLEESYQGIVRDKVDGPDARRWLVEVDGSEIEVLHESDWGNTLAATSAAGDDVVQTIGDDLAARLAGMPAPTPAPVVAEHDEAARGLMKKAMEVLGDRDADANIEARRDRRERQQELIIVGQRAARDPSKAAVVFLADLDELGAYLKMRGASVVDGEVRLELDAGGTTRSVVGRWDTGAGHVVFTDGADSHRASIGSDGRLSSRAVEEALAAFK